MRINSFNFFALLLLGVFAILAFSLFFLALDSEAEVWGHLSSTVLPVYLSKSLILLLGVGMGTLVLGVVSGFLTALFEFPGRRWLEWMLMLPMAMPAYILAKVYLELLDFLVRYNPDFEIFLAGKLLPITGSLKLLPLEVRS